MRRFRFISSLAKAASEARNLIPWNQEKIVVENHHHGEDPGDRERATKVPHVVRVEVAEENAVVVEVE